MSSVAQLTMHSPVGEITLSEADGAIVSLDWGRAPPEFQAETPLLKQARDVLNRYFDGDFSDHNLPLTPSGTAFQQKVWAALRQIPVGETATYADVARRIGQPTAARAVARACATNGLAVAIPCHRVVRSDGRLSGYRWGPERRASLLDREGSR